MNAHYTRKDRPILDTYRYIRSRWSQLQAPPLLSAQDNEVYEAVVRHVEVKRRERQRIMELCEPSSDRPDVPRAPIKVALRFGVKNALRLHQYLSGSGGPSLEDMQAAFPSMTLPELRGSLNRLEKNDRVYISRDFGEVVTVHLETPRLTLLTVTAVLAVLLTQS